jgi:hypothetical protein
MDSQVGVKMPDGVVVSLFDMTTLAIRRWNITASELNGLVYEEARKEFKNVDQADDTARRFSSAGMDAMIQYLLAGNDDPYWAYITLIWRMAEIANKRS